MVLKVLLHFLRMYVVLILATSLASSDAAFSVSHGPMMASLVVRGINLISALPWRHGPVGFLLFLQMYTCEYLSS